MTLRLNPAVASLTAYVPGEQPRETDWVKLNTNESPYPPSPEVVEAVVAEARLALFNKYPDPVSNRLREALAKWLEVDASWIIAGNGSDEILRMICHAFLDPAAGDAIGMLEPTYVLYETIAASFGCPARRFAAGESVVDLPAEALNADVKVLFIPNPNPPYGTQFSLESLKAAAQASPHRLLVVDEAYVDFAGGSAIGLTAECPNVLVTRTFSKSASLAGLRVGYGIARPELLEPLWKVKDSYNLDRLCQAAATAAVEAWSYYSSKAERIVADRDFLAGELRARGFRVAPSAGNFLFARCAAARDLYMALKSRKILVRHFDTPTLRDGVRITIGLRTELERLLEGIDQAVGAGEIRIA